MAGTFIKPKAFNRRWWINIGTTAAPAWAEIAHGISSRGNSINETKDDYYDMAGRGVAESDITGVTVQRSFTGVRVIGDAAQDNIIDRLYELNRRAVEYIECYDNMVDATKPNGRKGTATLSITDDGSGDAAKRENIAFALNIQGTPTRGQVAVADGVPTFTEAV
jgi:hypothetical protein